MTLFKNFFKIEPPKYKILNKEALLKNMIQIKGHWNNDTLITDDDSLIQIVKLGGFSFETADDEDLDIRKTLRNNLFKNLFDSEVKLYSHIIRRKKNSLSS
jgi:type IV secretion system protein VirB4